MPWITRRQVAEWEQRVQSAEDRLNGEIERRNKLRERYRQHLQRVEGEANGQIRALETTISRLIDQNTKLTDKLVEQPTAILDSVGGLMYPNPPAPAAGDPTNPTAVQQTVTAMGAQGLDNMGGVRPGEWFPEIEFDEAMESSQQWPTPGRISQPPTANTPTTPSTLAAQAAEAMTGNGTKEMFRSGEASSPPAGGVE